MNRRHLAGVFLAGVSWLSCAFGHASRSSVTTARVELAEWSFVAAAAYGVVAWNERGDAQRVTTDGVVLRVVSLPVAKLRRMTWTGTQLLGLGFDAQDRQIALAVDGDLRVSGEWVLPSEWFEIVLGEGPPSVISGSGIYHLEPDGRLERHADILRPPSMERSQGAVHGFQTAHGLIVCQDEDKAKATANAAWCALQQRGAWQVRGRFIEPLVCEAHLVVRTPRGPHRTAITIYSTDTGKQLKSVVVKARPSIACAVGPQLVVATNGITGRTLPSLKQAWNAPTDGAVTAVGAFGGTVAYQMAGTNELSLLKHTP